MNVGDLMSTNLIVVEPHQDLGVALALMYEFDIRRLPVVDSERGVLIGIVSDRDLRLAMESPMLHQSDDDAVQALESILVGEVMHTSLVVVEPGASIGDAARRMLSHKVSGLPVVQSDEAGNASLVGIITTTDLLRYVADLEGEPATEG